MRTAVLAVLALALCGCGSQQMSVLAPTASPASSLRQVHDPGRVTGTITGPCSTRAGGQLPDPLCTPGSYDPAISAAILCSSTYRTSSYRPDSSQTTRAKYDVVEPAYSMAHVSGELDHLVSLELGGSNDLSNLWIEAGPIPNPKDKVENALHDWVCAGGAGVAQGRLTRAQAAIATDWLTAEQVLGISG